MKLCIFGFGYVGRQVAKVAAENQYEINIVDTDDSVISAINQGEILPDVDIDLATTEGRRAVPNSDIIICAVPTPLDHSQNVDLTALRAVTDIVSDCVSNTGTTPLFVIESTIPPGTTRDIVVSTIESKDCFIGEDIYVAHVPERINPGSTWSIEEIPRVAGAVTEEGRQKTLQFYDVLLDAPIHPVESPSIAEASKIVENAYRDINIAYVNEVALALDQLNIDTEAVLDAADTKPFGFTRFSPGAGVGGHCIPIDPYFLIRKAHENGFNNRFLKYAREVNDYMPNYVAQKAIEGLNNAEILPNGSRVLLLGMSFKSNVADTRNSPYFEIKSELERFGVNTETYDPQIPKKSTVSSPYIESDAVVLITDHDEFQSLSFAHLSNKGVNVFVDGRNAINPDRVEKNGIQYTGIGR